ncbi:MAG: hypothetical protein FJ255_12535, partial [Phycisphaerae bacterium]|nr:hypothetical protein [Phycisphaerae bacterium]
MTGELYHAAARAKAAPPADWPAPALATWAGAAVRAAVAPVEAANLSLHWTRWQGVQETLGDLYSGTWGELCAWLDSTRAASVADKREVPPWAPARFDGDWRADDATLALYALALDCDDGGDWTALLAALDRAGLAYLAHRSPSHRDEGGPCKWRLILPLAAPVEGGALERWRNAYTAARLAFGALGRCWFDPTCGNPSRMWFAASAVGNAPRRELRKGQGRALDLLALLDRVPALPAPVRPELPRLDQGARRAPGGAPLDRVARAAAWLDKRDPAVQGQGGDQHTLATVAKVVRGFAVPDADAWPLLQAWNARCVPPWNDAELRDKMANARKYGSEPYGAALDAPPPARLDRAELRREAADWRAERAAPQPAEPDEAPQPPADAPLAIPLGELGWLDPSLTPPPLPVLLTCKDGTGAAAPFLALGKVAMLAAPGGVGKTQALLQLAMSVASGKLWLDTYSVKEPGPVLFLAAEEDDGELWRRVRKVADALDLTPAEREAVGKRMHCAPLHGCGEDLALLDNTSTRFQPANLKKSAMWEGIDGMLSAPAACGEPWRLVIIDPAARWMPPDAEMDPKIATAFVEALEALAVRRKDGGDGPAVLVAHHANKQALRGDTDQGASRGTSALTDGVRWQANL